MDSIDKKHKFLNCYKKRGIPPPLPFSKLEPTTHTVMVYTNIQFDVPKIYWDVPIFKTDVKTLAKQDRKNFAPYGAILCIQSNTCIRGIVSRKKKKHWCTVCRQVKCNQDNEKEYNKGKKIKYITEIIKEDIHIKNLYHILYYCSFCDRIYHPRDIKKINHFPHQATIILSIGNKIPLNIMMFKDSLKIAGAKTLQDAMEGIHILWSEYITKIPNSFTCPDKAEFLFSIEMMNFGFSLGFPMDRRALNDLMNDKYADIIALSCIGTTSNPNVKIKFHVKKPKNFRYNCLVFDFYESEWTSKLVRKKENKYKKIKVQKDKYNTFIVFSSSETILSGKYRQDLENIYNIFIELIYKNNLIQEIKRPDKCQLEALLN